MVYNSVSIENVIGRVLRNTQLTDTSALENLYEWLPEGMELLETQYQMTPEYKDLKIKFHQAPLPCGLLILDAVEYNNKRLRTSNTARPVHAPKLETAYSSNATIFNTIIDRETNEVTGNSFTSSSLEQASNLDYCEVDFYYTKPNYICTSMKEADIRLFYKTPPLDENGFPLVPDNGNYKEALYWWGRGKLIGAGLLNDSNQSEDSCLAKFEMYGARAVGEITYPSVDRMERIRANQVRLVAPQNYWRNFNNI